MLAELVPELIDSDEIKYCHILCCHPHFTLCGTYKQIPCGVAIVNSDGTLVTQCPACNKDACPDCMNLIDRECPWCL